MKNILKDLFRNDKRVAFLLYAALICAVYSQVVFFGKTLIPNLYYPKELAPFGYQGRMPINSFNIDLATPAFYEMPTNKLVGDMYLNRQLPLWNPYQGAGTPLGAQYSTRAFFPYQILENISPAWLWDYFILGRLLAAAFFTYLFLKLLGISSPCAFLGGAFYSLSGSFTWFINLEQFTNVAMMLPVCLFSLERLLMFKKRCHIAEAAIVFSLMLLAGQPEIAVYAMLLLLSYYLFKVIIERPKFLFFLKAALKFLGISFLGLGLCAFLILPFLEFITNAYQCHPLGGDMGVREPTALRVAISVLMPSFFELPTHYRIFPHNGVWDWLGGYSGVLMICLILLAYFYKGKYRKLFLFFSFFGFFIILKNFGFPLISWVGRLPLLDQSWSPRWAGCVWTFCLSISAALGLEILYTSPEKKKSAPWIVLSLLLTIIGFFLYKTAYLPQLKGLNSEQLKIALPPILGGIIVSLSIFFTCIYLFFNYKDKKALVYGIIFLAITELWFYIPRGTDFPWTAYKFIPFLLGIVTVILLVRERWRLAIITVIIVALCYTFIDIASPYGFPDRYNLFKKSRYVKFLEQDKSFFRVVAGDGILMPNFSSAFKIFDVRYINSLSPVHYQNYVDNHLLKEGHLWFSDRLWFTGLSDINKSIPRSIYEEINDNLLYYSYLGVKYILAPKNISLNFPLVYDEKIKIYKNPYSFPRVYIAHNIKYASDYQEAQTLMGGLDFDIKDTILLEEKPPAWYKAPSGNHSKSNAGIERYSYNRIEISADLESDGILVLTDVFYPGWKVYVDNKETKITRINGIVRGVFLKKGNHDIIFTYSPFSFKIGLIISLISLILCVLLIFI